MFSSLMLWIAIVGELARLAGLAAFLRTSVRGLSVLAWYLLFAMAMDFSEYFVLHRYGYRSHAYSVCYYAFDIAIIIAGYIVLARLVEIAFVRSRMQATWLRRGALLLFTGVATISAWYVYIYDRLTLVRFGIRLEQNMSYLGMILSLLLWVGMNGLLTPGLRFRRVVLSFSILYSSCAMLYALHQLIFIPHFPLLVQIVSNASIVFLAFSLWTAEPELEIASQPEVSVLATAETSGGAAS